MHESSQVNRGVRPVLGSPGSLAVARMDGWLPGLLGGGSWLCFKHPVVRYQVLSTDLGSSAVLTLYLTTPHLPPWATPNFLYGESRSETGPNRRCSGPKQYQKLFRYYP